MKEKIREIRSIWNTMNVDIVQLRWSEITRLQKLSEKWTIKIRPIFSFFISFRRNRWWFAWRSSRYAIYYQGSR